MTLPKTGLLTAGDIRTEAQQGNTWDINDPVERQIARVPGDKTPIKFSDFYGKSRYLCFNKKANETVCNGGPGGGVSVNISDSFGGLAAGTWVKIATFVTGTGHDSGGQDVMYISYPLAVRESYVCVGTPKTVSLQYNGNGGNYGYYFVNELVWDGTTATHRYRSGGNNSIGCHNGDFYILGAEVIASDPGLAPGTYSSPYGGVSYGPDVYYTGLSVADYLSSKCLDTTITTVTANSPPAPPAAATSTSDTSASTINSCFLVDSLIRMADGTDKLIQDAQIGDLLMGAHGSANPVLALNRPLLGNRMMSTINNEHATTLDHAHLRPGNTFGAVSLYEYVHGENNTVQKVIVDQSGTEEWWLLPGFHDSDMDMITQIELGDYLVTVDGKRQVVTMEQTVLPADTQLYNFVMGGDHTYFVNGYCVTGFLNAHDFNYRTWMYNGKPWTAADYRQTDHR